MTRSYSAVMGPDIAARLKDHLVRHDRQEDICFALWRPSTGSQRTSAVIFDIIDPLVGERHLHGNASFESSYTLRAIRLAVERGAGIALLHSHPGARTWQGLSAADQRAEASIANLARELTGLPLVGLTLATGNVTWSARFWEGVGREVKPTWCSTVRAVTDRLRVSFNDELHPKPRMSPLAERTVHSWGPEVHANLARLKVLVVGVGSVGMLVLEALARTGIESIGVLEFDNVEFVNLDRLHGATALDAYLLRAKADVARRILTRASVASEPMHEVRDGSICEADGLSFALDYDVIFSCVDRPWPRHVLNTLAYADLVPVIDGGLRLDRSERGLRNAYWRSHIARPGQPCLACLGQYGLGDVQADRDGSLDTPSYVAGLPPQSALRANQNVAALSMAAASAQLNQFLSLVVAPADLGDPGPEHFSLASRRHEILDVTCREECDFMASIGEGDRRLDPTAEHHARVDAQSLRSATQRRLTRRAVLLASDVSGQVERYAIERATRAGSRTTT
jgi:hypothetical protein